MNFATVIDVPHFPLIATATAKLLNDNAMLSGVRDELNPAQFRHLDPLLSTAIIPRIRSLSRLLSQKPKLNILCVEKSIQSLF
jgi:hypothetical protein